MRRSIPHDCVGRWLSSSLFAHLAPCHADASTPENVNLFFQRTLREEETRKTARRVFQNNSRLTLSEIGKAIGRSRQAVDSYIADLRAATQMGMDIKIFRMSRLWIPQERIAKRLRIPRTTLETHLTKMPGLANSSKADLSKGFTVAQVAEKHDRQETRPEIEPHIWTHSTANPPRLSEQVS